jgi:cytochrome c peroxidase
MNILYAADADTDLLKQAQALFQPLPRDMGTPEFPITPERVDLGRKLFFDPRISVDGTVSCARCHQPALYGTDGLAKPRGAHDKLNPRNAPTGRFSLRLIGAATARTSRIRRSRP